MNSFVHLHNHSEYSLLDGMSNLEKMVAKVKSNNQPGIAITDHGTLTAHYDCWKASNRTGVKLIPGIEAEFEKKSAFGALVITNLNPTGDR